MRLIDADALVAMFNEKIKQGADAYYLYLSGGGKIDYAEQAELDTLNYSCELIEQAPTVDAVEVVRCKDCKYCTTIQSVPTSYVYYRCDHPVQICEDCFDCWLEVDVDDYCSYGERKVSE